MFHMHHIVRKLKAMRLKPGSKRNERTKNAPQVSLDEVGYEASSLLSQTDHGKKNRKP